MGGLGTELNLLNTQVRKNFFEHCTNCAILPRPLSHDHFCEKSASLLFHSSARERLQIIYLLLIYENQQFVTCTVGLTGMKVSDLSTFFMSAYRFYDFDVQTLQFWQKHRKAAHRLDS